MSKKLRTSPASHFGYWFMHSQQTLRHTACFSCSSLCFPSRPPSKGSPYTDQQGSSFKRIPALASLFSTTRPSVHFLTTPEPHFYTFYWSLHPSAWPSVHLAFDLLSSSFPCSPFPCYSAHHSHMAQASLPPVHHYLPHSCPSTYTHIQPHIPPTRSHWLSPGFASGKGEVNVFPG